MKREDQQESKPNIPRRALTAIPAFEVPSSKTSIHLAIEGKNIELRLILHVALLNRAHRFVSAVRLLLDFYRVSKNEKYWNWVLKFIEMKDNAAELKQRTEMVTALLMYCLDPANQLAAPHYIEDVWKLMSSNVSPLDLVNSLRQELVRIHKNPQTVIVGNEQNHMTVETLRKQLFRLGLDS